MIGTVINVILDVLVLGALGVAIYYARKLTIGLETFRKVRKDFEGVMRELSRNIDEAYAAVDGLKRATKSSGADLQKSLTDSKSIAHELKILSEAGGKLADRLEMLGERNLRIMQGFEDPDAFADEFAPAAQNIPDEPSFSIYDRGEEVADPFESPAGPPIAPANFQSQAERDLFEALQKTTRKTSGRGAA